MKNHNVVVGCFVVLALSLFATGLFLIGDKHKAFRHHADFYVSFENVNGIDKGSKVRVDGMDAGQVESIEIPPEPSKKFLLHISVDRRLSGLIRTDSIVSIETEGIVGDKFILVHQGSEGALQATDKSNLRGKEPFEMEKMLEQAQSLLKQADGTMVDVRDHLDRALIATTTTLNNANGMISDVRNGKGTAGLLLEDRRAAMDVQQTIVNARDLTQNLNASALRIGRIVGDLESRQFVSKMDDTVTHARGATDQLEQASGRINATLGTAFVKDQYGEDAGSNLQQSFTNINHATGNLADDTEALKHQFFFRGFFKKRGYDSLDDLPIEAYRRGKVFRQLQQTRFWISAESLLAKGANGEEVLSVEGRLQIDQAIAKFPNLYGNPLVIEGYSPMDVPSEGLARARERAALVRGYVQLRFHVLPKNTGVIALGNEPPTGEGKVSWDGICLVSMAKGKK